MEKILSSMPRNKVNNFFFYKIFIKLYIVLSFFCLVCIHSILWQIIIQLLSNSGYTNDNYPKANTVCPH